MEGMIWKGMPQAASSSRRRGDAEARMSAMVFRCRLLACDEELIGRREGLAGDQIVPHGLTCQRNEGGL
jgi:hypothetical protein